jgi:hypothetical protein
MAHFMQKDCLGKPRLLRMSCLAVLALALLGTDGAGAAKPAPAAAKPATAEAKPATTPVEKWEGFWARNRKDCRNQDGFDSKTQIDLKGMENGKPAPLYDQYENHCRIDSHATRDKVTTLKLTCYEFWDDYKAKKNPRRDSIAVTVVDPQKITMNGKSFIRCKK